MTTNDAQRLTLNCFLIEALVKSLVIEGITDNEKLVSAVNNAFPPLDKKEMEMYSEAIIYAKYSVLN